MNGPAVFQDMIMRDLARSTCIEGRRMNGEVEIERKNNDPMLKCEKNSE